MPPGEVRIAVLSDVTYLLAELADDQRGTGETSSFRESHASHLLEALVR